MYKKAIKSRHDGNDSDEDANDSKVEKVEAPMSSFRIAI